MPCRKPSKMDFVATPFVVMMTIATVSLSASYALTWWAQGWPLVRAWQQTTSATNVTVISDPTTKQQYLVLPYTYNDVAYVAYVPFKPAMLARGYRVTDPHGVRIPLNPGALPDISAATLGHSTFRIMRGSKLIATTTTLDSETL